MKRNRNKGFSLIELMIVVVIIGILSAVAIPAYSDYVLRGKLTDAYTWLADSRVKMEQYYQDNRTYVSGVAPTCGLVLPTSKYFTFSCSAAAVSYVATATGIAAQGTGSLVYTINESNAKATTGVPVGWASNGSCWVSKKDGSC